MVWLIIEAQCAPAHTLGKATYAVQPKETLGNYKITPLQMFSDDAWKYSLKSVKSSIYYPL